MKTQAQIQQIMQRAQALKQRLSNASSASNASEASNSSFQHAELPQQAASVPQLPCAPQQEPQGAWPCMPEGSYSRPCVNYAVLPRPQHELLQPIQDQPFLCLFVVNNFRFAKCLANLSPTGVVKNVYLSILVSPLLPTNEPYILFDYTKVQEISLQMILHDGEDDYVIAEAPIFNQLQLNQLLLTARNKRRYSRACIELVCEQTVQLKSTLNDANSVGSLQIATADFSLFGGGAQLQQFANSVGELGGIEQYNVRQASVQEKAVQTEACQRKNPMSQLKPVKTIQVVFRAAGVAFSSTESYISLYYAFCLQQSPKISAITGVSRKWGITDELRTSKQFTIAQREFQFADAPFCCGIQLSLSESAIQFMQKGAATVCVFGLQRTGQKSLIGAFQLKICQNQANWVNFSNNDGFCYCDCQVIEGREEILSYDKILQIRGFPAEYELLKRDEGEQHRQPDYASVSRSFAIQEELNPMLSRVAPLAQHGGYDEQMEKIINIGAHVDALFGRQ